MALAYGYMYRSLNKCNTMSPALAKAVRLAAPVLAGLLLAGFTFLAIRGLIDPAAGSTRFGLVADDAAARLFYRVYLSRNLVIIAAGLAFLLTGMWRALAILCTAAIFLPAFDHVVLQGSGVVPPAFHLATLVVVSLIAAVLWLRTRVEG